MKVIIAMFLLPMAVSNFAADMPNDPRTRDESVSGMTISTKIERNSDGQYRYIYTFKGEAADHGTVTSWNLNVNCPDMPNKGKQNFDEAGFTRDADFSRDGRHVPLVSKLVGSPTRDAAFSANNVFDTLIMLMPGHTRVVELISPNKPGYLHFWTTISSGNETQYDYTELWENDGDVPDIPWYEDWEVHGLVKGPACVGNEATPMTKPIFSGQKMPDERHEINELLSYEVAGDRNRWHAPASQTEIKLRVYYSYNVNLSTFTATLNGRDIKSLFHPSPYSSEWVTLPLEGARTLIELSVLAKAGVYEDGERYPTRRDVDPFEIRRPVPPAP